MVWSGRLWFLSFNLYAIATEEEKSEIPAKPEKPKKEASADGNVADKADKKAKGRS